MRNTSLPDEIEFSRIACGYNVIKRKNEFSKVSRKKMNFVKRLKNAEHKIFCICRVVYGIYEGKDQDKLFELLSKLKKNIKE